MNRKQRREYNKAHKTTYTKADFDMALALARIKNGNFSYDDISKVHGSIHMDNEELAPEGTLVKLNYDDIYSRPQEMLTPEFKAWVEANKDKEFHLTREGAEDSLVCFAEDEEDVIIDGKTERRPRWLFDLYSDILIKVGDEWKHPYDIDETEVKTGYTDITEQIKIAEEYSKHVDEQKASEADAATAGNEENS